MQKIIDWYLNYISKLEPSRTWVKVRTIIHWLTLPIKLIIIFIISIIMHIYMFSWKKRKMESFPNNDVRKEYFKYIYYNLPVFDNNFINLYVNRIKYNDIPDGMNHNDDHQAARHGTYAFLMSILGKRTGKIDEAVKLHFQKQYGIVRGYKMDQQLNVCYNGKETSGDQLLGLCMAMLPYTLNQDNTINLNNTKNGLLIEEFERSIVGIIENDYAIRSEDGKKKSTRAMWQPGLETVGAQSITILAALKLAESLGSTVAKNHYKILTKRYGYALLSLFPTTFIPSQRGYFNDHNCLVAAYILTKLSNGWAKKYWTFVMLYIWSLSYKWYNGYFTGLIENAAPGIISKKYIQECKQYLYEDKPCNLSRDGAKKQKPLAYPVSFNLMNQGEFHPDQDHTIIISGTEKAKYKSGLGWLAHAVMIDPEESKKFLL